MKCKNCGHAIRRRVFELDGVVMFEYIHAKGGKTCKLITGGKNLPFGKLCGCVEAESESSKGEKGDGIRTEGSLTSDESSNARANPSPRKSDRRKTFWARVIKY